MDAGCHAFGATGRGRHTRNDIPKACCSIGDLIDQRIARSAPASAGSFINISTRAVAAEIGYPAYMGSKMVGDRRSDANDTSSKPQALSPKG